MKTHRFFSVFLLLILAVSLLTGPASAAEVPDPAIHAKLPCWWTPTPAAWSMERTSTRSSIPPVSPRS